MIMLIFYVDLQPRKAPFYPPEFVYNPAIVVSLEKGYLTIKSLMQKFEASSFTGCVTGGDVDEELTR